MDLEVGSLIQNKYRIVKLIGQGGMGAVYEGENVLIARRVAIKVLYGAVAAQHGVVERFEREAQAAGRIGNDHILEVLDMGTLGDGNRFMVMEFLDGETLGERVARLGRLTAKQIAPLARQLLVGLAAAHHAGIIHRDLKPENVFVLREKAGQPDFVKIIDFGISKFTALDQDMKMTATGAVMGTPYFMSPEQAKGSRGADIRSDLYAVGVIIYKSITGLVPFDGATFNELLFKIVLSPVPYPREQVPDLDPAFETIIMKAMARDPAFRFQTAESFIQALDAWLRTGAGVTVPPPEASGYNQPQVIGPHTPSGTLLGNNTPATMGTEAKGTWTQSGVDGAAPKVPTKSLAPWLALGAVLAAGAAGAAFWFMQSNTAPVAEPVLAADSVGATSGQAPSSPELQPEIKAEPVVAPVLANPAEAAALASASAGSGAAQSTPPTSQQDPAPQATGTPQLAGTTPGAPKANTPKRQAPRPSAPTAPAPRPKPRGNTSPDFGY